MSGAVDWLNSNAFGLRENGLVVFKAFVWCCWEIVRIWGQKQFSNALWRLIFVNMNRDAKKLFKSGVLNIW